MAEGNVAMCVASAGASISSSGLSSAIPALTLLTGRSLAWPSLAMWVFSVSVVGVAVAVGLQRQFLIADALPFPHGIATAEALHDAVLASRKRRRGRIGAIRSRV